MYKKPESPLSIGGVLDDGFRLMKASYSSVIAISLAGAIIGQMPNLVGQGTGPDGLPNMSGAFGLVYLLAVPVGLIAYGAIIAIVNAIANGQSMSIRDGLGTGARRIFAVLFCGILYGLAVVGGSLLLIIPGIILMVSMGLGLYLVVSDSLGPLEALKTSHRLVWGNWWRTLVIFSVVMFALFTLYMVVGLLAAFSIDAGGGAGATIGALGTGLIGGLVNPVIYAMSIALINDLKLRKQGDDLAERIETLES